MRLGLVQLPVMAKGVGQMDNGVGLLFSDGSFIRVCPSKPL